MTVERYEDLLKSQGGVCAMCGGVNKNGFRLGVDHNHKTGVVRGLLCVRCNKFIVGRLTKEQVQRLYEYFEKYEP